MKGKKYSLEFKELVLNDAKELKNIILVAKKHNWLRKNNAKISYKSNEIKSNYLMDFQSKIFAYV